jgi:hypothetical protein
MSPVYFVTQVLSTLRRVAPHTGGGDLSSSANSGQRSKFQSTPPGLTNSSASGSTGKIYTFHFVE